MFEIYYTYNEERKIYKSYNYEDAVRMYNNMFKHDKIYKDVKKNFSLPV